MNTYHIDITPVVIEAESREGAERIYRAMIEAEGRSILQNFEIN